jgi:hypothetical protein
MSHNMRGEPEATPSANNVILRRAQKTENARQSGTSSATTSRGSRSISRRARMDRARLYRHTCLFSVEVIWQLHAAIMGVQLVMVNLVLWVTVWPEDLATTVAVAVPTHFVVTFQFQM